jgi:hypothetical protein
MPIPHKRAREILRGLGIQDAKGWADEEAKYPCVARLLFLKALWSNVIADDNAWMDEWADAKHPIPSAIRRMLAKGIDPDDLTDVVRDMQVELLFNVCCSLDDSAYGIEELQAKIPENVEWRLAEWDGEKEKLKRPMRDIHGDFYDLDPTGRRGEPRKRSRARRKT